MDTVAEAEVNFCVALYILLATCNKSTSFSDTTKELVAIKLAQLQYHRE